MPCANAGTEIANPPTTASARIALMTLSFPSGGGTAALVKDGQPLAGIVAMFAANLIEDSDGFGGAREHGQLVGEAAEIQFHHNGIVRSEEHTSELQSLMRISYAVFCLKKKNKKQTNTQYKAGPINTNDV